MGNLQFILFALLLTHGAAFWTKSFCSVFCTTNSCNGNSATNCNNKCMTNWVVSGNTCAVNTAANWVLVDTSNDIAGGTITVGSSTATTNLCGSFTLFGWNLGPTTVSITYNNGIKYPYYQLVAYLGIISQDAGGSPGKSNWQKVTIYTLEFVGVQMNTQKLSSRVTNQKYCGSNWNDEYYNRFAQTYTYNVQSTPLVWNVYNDEINTAAAWGIKEFILIARKCNVACTDCYGYLATQCNACNTTLGMWLSNNTCNLTCLNNFGYTSTTGICVWCDRHCTACYLVADNCTSCTRSGTYIAYLNTQDPTYQLCVNPCPTGYFGNKINGTCDPCDSVCAECLNSASYCTSCLIGGWTGWYCYSPCPVHYFQPNTTNCTKCNSFCDVCVGASNNCTSCILNGTYKAFLYNTTSIAGSCDRVCPTGYYGQTYGGLGPNLCLICDSSCTICTGSPNPCSACATTYYLFNSSCVNPCPNGTFESNSTGMCLNCSIYCVDLSIVMSFADSLNQQLYVDMVFSEQLNFTTFNCTTFQNITIASSNMQYNMDMFTLSYVNTSKKSYRIILEPKSYIFLYNATFTITTQTQPSPVDTSLASVPFKSTNYLKSSSISWFLIKGPPFTNLEKGIMNSFSTLSSKTNDLLTLPIVQQIKKSGVFNFLFSGAQITSCSVLANAIQSQNLYEGVRFWAIFVFFDVPPYEKISNKTKYFFKPSVQNQIRNAQENVEQKSPRSLFSTNSMYWRFQRTGQTSFFIYDVYIPMILLAICWVAMIVAHCCKQASFYYSHAPKLFSFVHKVHEISLMYFTMAAIVEFIYFTPSSTERIVSAIICIIFNVYFIFYQLYIYYDMIRYPMAQIGNKTYEYYILRYGSFLKNIRFQEYSINEKWSPKQWFRPYNFHILSYYKKFIMIISLPLFYNVLYAQMAILAGIQILELARVCYMKPFKSKKRNYLRVSFQAALLVFFLVNLAQTYLLQIIMVSDSNSMGPIISIFYGFGWVGFVLCFYFNLGHIMTGIYDFCRGFRISNRQMMDEARKIYYYQKIREHESTNFQTQTSKVNRWVRLGNLNNRSYGDLPEINVRIESYKLKKVGPKFEVQIRKLLQLYMTKETNYRKSNNTTAGDKINKQLVIGQADNYKLYAYFYQAYNRFESNHVEVIIIKTFLRVQQKKFKEGQMIPFNRSEMFQKVELISYDNEKQVESLDNLMQGFPIDARLFEGAY